MIHSEPNAKTDNNVNELNVQIDNSQAELQSTPIIKSNAEQAPNINKEIIELQNKVYILEKQLNKVLESAEVDTKQVKKLKHEILLAQHAINKRNKLLSKPADRQSVSLPHASYSEDNVDFHSKNKKKTQTNSEKSEKPTDIINLVKPDNALLSSEEVSDSNKNTNITTKQASTYETTLKISVINNYIERAITQLNNNSN